MPTTMKLIAKNVLGSDTSSVTFSDIPGTGYTDLFVSMSARSDRNSSPSLEDSLKIQFNSDTGNNYSSRILYGATNNNNVASAAETSVGYAVCYVVATSNANTASTFGSCGIYIPNYTGSTNKSLSVEGVSEQNGTNAGIGVAACLWSNTAAISAIKLFPYHGSNWKSGSSFFLFGITKA